MTSSTATSCTFTTCRRYYYDTYVSRNFFWSSNLAPSIYVDDMIPKSLRKILNGLKRKNSLERKSRNVSAFASSEATYKKLVYNLHILHFVWFIYIYYIGTLCKNIGHLRFLYFMSTKLTSWGLLPKTVPNFFCKRVYNFLIIRFLCLKISNPRLFSIIWELRQNSLS